MGDSLSSQVTETTPLTGEIFFRMGYRVSLVATFGENLTRLRQRAGFKTAKALADAVGALPSVVSKMETNGQGLPEGQTLLRYAKVLRCSIEELLAGIDPDYDQMLAATRAHSPVISPINEKIDDPQRRDPVRPQTDQEYAPTSVEIELGSGANDDSDTGQRKQVTTRGNEPSPRELAETLIRAAADLDTVAGHKHALINAAKALLYRESATPGATEPETAHGTGRDDSQPRRRRGGRS